MSLFTNLEALSSGPKATFELDEPVILEAFNKGFVKSAMNLQYRGDINSRLYWLNLWWLTSKGRRHLSMLGRDTTGASPSPVSCTPGTPNSSARPGNSPEIQQASRSPSHNRP